MAQQLRQATRRLHAEVERSGPMPQLLRGSLPRPSYLILQRNLHALYDALEAGLARHAAHPGLAALPLAALARRDALATDLLMLHGPGWAALPLVPATRAYAARLQALADGAGPPVLLAAHAYVRYLGDLSGGQVVARQARLGLGLAEQQPLAFHDFGPPERVAQLATAFRDGLDRLADDEAAAAALQAEAIAAFEHHRAIFGELAALADGDVDAAPGLPTPA